MFGRNKGSSLITVIIGSGLLLMVLFTMAEAVIFHLQFANSLNTEHEARNLAQAAVHEALAELLTSDQYGRNSTPPLIVAGDGDPSRNYGIVSFVADGRVPRSLNNLGSLNQITGSTGHGVPGNTVHLVGRGRSGSSERTVEVLFYRPPFPKAMSSSGPIVASNARVTGLKADTAYPPSDPNNLVPGSLQSNSNKRGTTPAIKVINCQISGDVAAVGDVQVDAGSQVDGEIRMHGDPQPIPKIDVTARINDIKNADGTELLSGTIPGRKVGWYCGCPSGDLTINGDLDLENGVLWANENLTITGGVKGNGLVLCGGKVTIQKGCTLDADNLVALAAKGDVTLEGADRSDYFFQGLVYTNGNFSAEHLTVLGAVIADSSDPTRGGLTLRDVDMVLQPDAFNINKSVTFVVEDRGNERGSQNSQPPSVPPQGTPSSLRFQFSIRPESLRGGEKRFDFTVVNVNPTYPAYPAPKTWYWPNVSMNAEIPYSVQKLTRPDNNTKINWYKPMPSEDNRNDCYTQINNTIGLSPQQMLTRGMLAFPDLNSLMPSGERSRILMWVEY